MSESTAKRHYGRDALGGLMFLAGLFSAVSFFMALVQPEKAGEPSGFYMSVATFVGPISGVFASLGLVVLGWRLWSKGVELVVLRHLAGIAITTFTLSVLVGTMAPDLAGDFGAGVAAKVTQTFSLWVSVPTGIALVLLPAWFAWLRPAERAEETDASRSIAPKSGVSADSSGVSAAEAEALLPRPAAPAAASARVPPAPLPTAKVENSVKKQPTPPRAEVASPYPPDVRRTGGIPEGAKPLHSPHAQAQQSARHDDPVLERVRADAHHERRPADAPVARIDAAPAQRAAKDRVGEHAGAESDPRPSALAPLAEAARVMPPAPAAELAPMVEAFEADAIEDAVAEDEPAHEASSTSEFTVELASAAPAAEPHSATPPSPSWEQASLFEEPVDAYGTPLSLVESLRKESAAVEPAPAPAPVPSAPVELDLTGVDLDDDADVASVKPIEAVEPAAVVAPAPSEAPATAEPVEEPAPAPHIEAPTLFEDVASLSDTSVRSRESVPEPAWESASAAAEPEVAGEPVAAAPEVTPEPVVVVDESLEAPEAEVEFEEDLSDAEEAVEELDAAVAEDDDEPVEELVEDEPDASHQPTSTASASLFPDDPPARAVEPEVEAPAAAALADVVLKPQPAPAAARSRAKLTLSEPVFKAGCLFVERNRVAVSMLQREFAMDFKQATEVLDQLQKAGLIGPYLGGQRRDILMSLEQWKQQVEVG
jgi:hypothetical protein